MKTEISRRVVTLLFVFALLNSTFAQTAPTVAGAGQPGEPLGGQPPAGSSPSVTDFDYQIK